MYVPISAEAASTSLTMRVRGDSERARQMLVDRLVAVDPNMAQVSTLRTIARREAYLLGISFWLTLVLGVLALLLTVSGDAGWQIGPAVRLFDPVADAASLLCIVTACACAALIPALRAGRIDPVTALRQD